MSVLTKHVVIVGGGTAGWLTASLLAKQHGQSVKITLIESSTIPTVGVGEGTWPSMRMTLQKIGISESEFITKCNATFKQASKFVNWIANSNDEYYHPFTAPVGNGKIDIAAYWQDPNFSQSSFCDAVTFQSMLCREGIAPKSIANKEYETVANYGYHLDAGKFAELLKNHSVENLGVEHLIGNVTAVKQDQHGNIRAIDTDTVGAIEAEFFVDCSGFKSLLLGEALKVPFIAKNDILMSDTALAMQVPYENPQQPIACQTISTAQEAGWIWDIGLQQRRGVGYVYSSQYASEEQAKATLKKYVGPQADALTIRKIEFKTGHREIFWKNNCVAVGLASGFLEPLEASALMLVETSANFIADQLPLTSDEMLPMSRRFNQVFQAKWRGIIDFLKLHYVLSRREEPFWQANKAPSSIPESLSELLALWKHRSPNEYDFLQNYEAFSAESYAYVLYGAGFKTDFSLAAHLHKQSERAQKYFKMKQQQSEQLAYRLPRHRELIDQITQQGFAKI
ncbi:tryptophan halogenase family protein [Glaciecola sp. SC05]|uniref:tryptophan halogenase family protein n=1 Tax=Glaciecola sp. SC05 TaxID=1987355 RepID=UPI003526D031